MERAESRTTRLEQVDGERAAVPPTSGPPRSEAARRRVRRDRRQAAENDRASADASPAELPADLLALYEQARESQGGVGAALLRQRRCEGCHIELSGSELSAPCARPSRTRWCAATTAGAILVRTAESGL